MVRRQSGSGHKTHAPGALSHLQIKLFGGFEARHGSGPALLIPRKKAQALLAYLACRPGEAYPRDKLAALLWPETTDREARQSLRQNLVTLRRALPQAAISALQLHRESVMLRPTLVEVDVPQFERLITDGSPTALEQAAALYRGDLLEGIPVTEAPFEEWLSAERARLRELAMEVLARLLTHQRKMGEVEASVQTALRLLALDSLQEIAHRMLMRLYIQQGRRDAALRQYQVCVDVLQRDLGVEPEAETKQLYQEILRQRPVYSPALEPLSESEASTRPMPVEPFRFGGPHAETVCIGRETEMAEFRRVLEDALSGTGHLIMVVGEAGIGKSRLVSESAAEAHQRGFRVLMGRSYQTTQILPFGPWVDAFRAGGVINDRKVRQGLSLVWRAELGRLFPELGELGREPASGQADPIRLFEGMAQVLAQLVVSEPLFLILEDLNWADEMSLRLVSFLSRRVPGWPLVLVGTARDEDLTGAPILQNLLRELNREHRLEQIVLGPLSQGDTRTLVQLVRRDMSDASEIDRLAARIWAVSQGNPFMVVETMQALEEGRVPELPSALPLPERIRELVAARLERLSEQGRRLVAVAAVIGREFEFDLLQRAAGLSEREVAEGVEELVRHRVLQVVGHRFDLTHERVREVSYRDLLPPRRKLLHRQVAEALETLYADDLDPVCSTLAGHYSESEVWDKAYSYFRQAGFQATFRSAYHEAASCLERAVHALGQLPKSQDRVERAIDTRLEFQSALAPSGEFERMLHLLREAETLADTLADQRRLGLISAYMTQCFFFMAERDQAIESGSRALAAANGNLPVEVVTNLCLGQVHYFSADYRRAIELFKRNMEILGERWIAEFFGLPGPPAISCRFFMGWCLGQLGEFAAGRTLAEDSVQLAEASDHLYSLVGTYDGLGVIQLLQGNLVEAIFWLERSFDLCRKGGFVYLDPIVAGSLGQAYALSGRMSEALPLLEEAAKRSGSMKWMVTHPWNLTDLSEAYLLAGRVADAMESAQRALRLARIHKQRGLEADILRIIGEILSSQAPPKLEKAEEYYHRAMALANELGKRPLVAHCHFGLANLSRKSGRHHATREHLTLARDLYCRMEMSFWISRADASFHHLK
jgi:DNA-binding SARP family transcriptional activator